VKINLIGMDSSFTRLTFPAKLMISCKAMACYKVADGKAARPVEKWAFLYLLSYFVNNV
jgi:hypothetical protein